MKLTQNTTLISCVSKAAALLDCSTLAIYQLAQERGVVLGASAEQYEKAKASLAQLEQPKKGI